MLQEKDVSAATRALHAAVLACNPSETKDAHLLGGDPDLVWKSVGSHGSKLSAFEIATARVAGLLPYFETQLYRQDHYVNSYKIWRYLRKHTKPETYDREFRRQQIVVLETNLAHIDLRTACSRGENAKVASLLATGLDPNRFAVLTQVALYALKQAGINEGPNPYMDVFHTLLASPEIDPNIIHKSGGGARNNSTTVQAITAACCGHLRLSHVDNIRDTAVQLITALLRHPKWNPAAHEQMVFVSPSYIPAIDDLLTSERSRMRKAQRRALRGQLATGLKAAEPTP